MSLLELPNRKTRLDTIANLWRKTEKYLILVEYGTKGGFQVFLKIIKIFKFINFYKNYISINFIDNIRSPRFYSSNDKYSAKT